MRIDFQDITNILSKLYRNDYQNHYSSPQLALESGTLLYVFGVRHLERSYPSHSISFSIFLEKELSLSNSLQI